MENEKIKVSIVCCTYNHEKYIRDTLDSLLEQITNFDYEIIVHDDASTDKTASIIKEYETKYPNIIKPIYEKTNLYSRHDGSIRKIVCSHVKGKYVAFCEGDDYWIDSKKLQKQFDFLENNKDYSMVCASTKVLNSQTGQWDCKRFIAKKARDISLEKDLIVEPHGRMFQTSSAMVVSKAYLDEQEWTKSFPYGDRCIWIQAGLIGKIRMTKDVVSVYRVFATGSWTERNKNSFIPVVEKEIEGFYHLDNYTNHRFKEYIDEAVSRSYFKIACFKYDWDTIRSKKYRIFYKELPIKTKVVFYLKCKHPTLFRYLYNLKHKHE